MPPDRPPGTGDPTDPSNPVSPLPPDDQQDRVESGRSFYTSEACVICHGDDGRTNVGNNTTLFDCPSCATWTQLRDAIATTMPPAAGNLEPANCVADCADRTADWIWAEVNGWPLTADGGARPLVASVNLGRNTQRVKSFSALKADFARVFGAAPPFLEDAEGAFPPVPEYWFRAPELGAVTLNVLVNAAVQSCQGELMPPLEAAAVRTQCQDWARRMWLRDATEDELSSCVQTALTITADLRNPRQQLEFACASMMVSLPSLTF